MTKEELITEIRMAFKGVELEDGIGLWEAQGIDDYADEKTIIELRGKDERKNWSNIPYRELAICESSVAFFDAKGMRFCLPQFLILDIIEEDLFKEEEINSPDIVFILGHELDGEYQKNRFSLFDIRQIQCVVEYLAYKLQQNNPDAELDSTIQKWKQKLK
jgi:hypothetical protein